jgi:hypothetical protein
VAAVLPSAANGALTGAVTFTVDNGAPVQAPVQNGTATLTVTVTSITTATASYGGNGAYLPSVALPFSTGRHFIPDSLDAACSDGTNYITCPTVLGDAAYGQDGSFTINMPTYTLSSSQQSVSDSVTGLVWSVLSSSPARDYATAGAYCSALNNAALDGITGWRLPSAREALTIADTGRNVPALATVFGSATNAAVWTTDAYAPFPSANWVLDLNYPVMMPSSRTGQTWPGTTCVFSGGTGASPIPTTGGAFIINVPTKPNVRLELGTGAYWQADTASVLVGNVTKSTFTWREALDYCANLSLDGITGWRLPSIKELWSIVDVTGANPAIDWSVFPSTVSGVYWTSSPFANRPYEAYAVDFSTGNSWLSDPVWATTNQYSVRCISGGAIPQQLYMYLQ